MVMILRVFIIGCVIAGLFSVLLGKELSWDLANYHYYNPYALLHARYLIDYWPASFIHQYFNPTIDFLGYFLINHASPYLSEFIFGAIHGINFGLLYLIALTTIPNVSHKNVIALIISFLGLYGPVSLVNIGSLQNDHVVALFVLLFVYLQIYGIKHHKLWLCFFLSPFILGLGIGLKLTTMPYLFGGLAAFFTLKFDFKIDRVKFFILFLSAVLFGIVLTGGYWMYWMWHEHQNPFFPFFNFIFHSKDFSNFHARDLRLFPKTWMQTIFYPFYFALDGRISDSGPFQDLRFPCLYIIYLIFGMACLKKKITMTIEFKWLSVFFLVSYIVWQWYFSVARYLMPLELLAPLMIYLFILHFEMKAALQASLIGFIFVSMFLFMRPAFIVRSQDYGTNFLNITLPASLSHVEKATVFITYPPYAFNAEPRPLSYLIPSFPPAWQFVGVPLNLIGLPESELYTKNIMQNIRYPKHLYLLSTTKNMPIFYHVMANQGLKPSGPCEFIFSARQKLVQDDISICPVNFV